MGNIILKITALVCAMALWFYVISLKDFQLKANHKHILFLRHITDNAVGAVHERYPG